MDQGETAESRRKFMNYMHIEENGSFSIKANQRMDLVQLKTHLGITFVGIPAPPITHKGPVLLKGIS